MPRDARASKVAKLLQANPAEAAPLEKISKQAGASPRTIERLFRSETNMGFQKWRRSSVLQFLGSRNSDRTAQLENR
jgi:transcriptional regulator GlxA family with amidase domain